VRAPVSVEDINGFIEFARSIADTPESSHEALRLLAGSVHPLVLGNAFRARTQIRMLAHKLMASQYEDEEQIERILQFLCSESGSHDYTINRREAIEQLKLPVTKPDDNLYSLIKDLYDDIAEELELTTPFDAGIVLGQEPSRQYSFRRAIIQSLPGGTHAFLTEGVLTRQQSQTPEGIQTRIHDHRIFQGWRYSNV
jgi:hypothetical protein